MEWSSNIVRSLGWDPGHHEEFRNGPENKIHIWANEDEANEDNEAELVGLSVEHEEARNGECERRLSARVSVSSRRRHRE
jgi:hypothetical protein